MPTKPVFGTLPNFLTLKICETERTTALAHACNCLSTSCASRARFLGEIMKQTFRLLAKPGTFFNQLQWSRHHWLILATFLGLAVVETHVGSRHNSHRMMAELLGSQMGLSFGIAFALLTSARLVLLLVAAFVGSWTIWFVGSLFGQQSSRRVFFRRLAIVATVILAGFTLRHFTDLHVWAEYAGWAVSAWGVVLGYFALREQFGLNRIEAIVMGGFALLAAITSWQVTQDTVEQAVRSQLANRPSVSLKDLR
jgi:hypothetical protein